MLALTVTNQSERRGRRARQVADRKRVRKRVLGQRLDAQRGQRRAVNQRLAEAAVGAETRKVARLGGRNPAAQHLAVERHGKRRGRIVRVRLVQTEECEQVFVAAQQIWK